MWMSVGCALAAAVLFALTSNLQREAAAKVPVHEAGALRLMWRLIRSRRWLAGSSVSVLGFVMQALALARGSVITVQAVIASNVAFALAMEAYRLRRRLRPVQTAGAALVLAGVAVLVVVGHPMGARNVSAPVMLQTLLVLAVVAAGGLLVAPRLRRRAPHLVPRLMAAGAGASFAIDAVFLKAATDAAGNHAALLTVAGFAGFGIASVCGNILVQRAYQSAPLREVLPTLAATEPFAAFLIAVLILHETLASGVRGVTGVLAGLAVLLTGIVLGTRASDMRVRPDGGVAPLPTEGLPDDPDPEPVHTGEISR